ncbi:MAG: phosphoglucosamine mutase [Candidatus Margulisbacteria bacterium]|nr:phosphoglucosamine mutase [Candidatus Margulisiibacteriota bacterium]
MTLKISISGVRGFVPESLTPEVCLNFAKAFGTYLSENKGKNPHPKVVIGTDSRASSEFIKGIVFQGLLSTGCEAVDLGICPTPTVGIVTRELRADGGIVITASHNPLPWNGLKFMRRDGIFLNEAQASRLIEIYENKSFFVNPPRKVSYFPSAHEVHIKKILKNLSLDAIRGKKIKVGVDSCNGAGAVISSKLLNKLGCRRVEAINCYTSLPFPRAPEPSSENLAQLCELVKSKKLDIGFAFDSDADRLAIVSNEGKPIGEELTLALAVKYILLQNLRLPKSRKIIVVNLSTTKAIEDVAGEFNAVVLRTKIGEVHVAEQLKELKGLIGGEGNGGVIYPPIGFNRDAMAGMAMILDLMARTGRKISDLAAEIPAYCMEKKKIDCRSQHEAIDYIEKIKERFRKSDLILTEGVKVVLSEGWAHVRASNTEPIIRIIAEGTSKEVVSRLIDKIMA